jgi:hypothetical protein
MSIDNSAASFRGKRLNKWLQLAHQSAKVLEWLDQEFYGSFTDKFLALVSLGTYNYNVSVGPRLANVSQQVQSRVFSDDRHYYIKRDDMRHETVKDFQTLPGMLGLRHHATQALQAQVQNVANHGLIIDY